MHSDPAPRMASGQTSAPEAESRDPRESGRIRLRVLALTLAAQAALIAWVADSEIAQSVYLICYSLMMPTVVYLLIGRALMRRFRLARQELLFGYIVLTCTLPIMGFGGMRFLITGMGYLPYFSATQPQWNAYLPALSSLPVLHDPEAIRALYRGGTGVPWQAWLLPIGFWSLYLLLLSGIWIGLAAVLHRIWIHQERLTFPITVLPIQLTDPRDDLFHRPLFWTGVAVPVVLQSLLVLHDWYPSVPAFQLKAFDIKPLLFTSPPWNALPDLQVGFYPMAIGLAYFVPSSVSFSCIFFWLATRLSYLVGTLFGVESAGTGAARFPFREEQAAGAWIAFAALAVWGVRLRWSHLMQTSPPRDRRDLRRLGALAALCMTLCAAMMTAVGISPLMALGTITLYVAYVLCGARVRGEAGGIWTFAPLSWTPARVMGGLLGTYGLPPRAMVAGGLFDLVHVDIRAQTLPYLLEGLKIGETAGLRWRTILCWCGVGTITALIFAWWFSLSQFYSLGAATAKSNAFAMWKTHVGMNEMHRSASQRAPFDVSGMTALLFGGGFTVLLAWLRMRLPFFPLHPVGYVLCNTLSLAAFFVPFLLAWLTKVLVLRYGGHALYRRSLAFFVGLILGDIGIQAGWALIGRLFQVPIYQFLS